MSLLLAELLEKVRSGHLDPLNLLLLEQVHRGLAEAREIDQLSVEALAASWLIRYRLSALLGEEDEEEIEPPVDARQEGALLRLVTRSVFTGAAGELAQRLKAASLATPVRVHAEAELAPVSMDPEALGPALAAAISRVRSQAEMVTVTGAEAVDITQLSRWFLRRLAEAGYATFREMVGGRTLPELVASFVLLLEAQAFGAVELNQKGRDIAIEVTDSARLGLVEEVLKAIPGP